jgi:SAM-dependent methyltransferase
MSARDARGIAGHWDAVYGSKAVDDVSWYQPDAGSSTRHVLAAAPTSASRVAVDVGAGTSTLVDELLDEGWRVTVLDVSAEALAVTRARLGERADAVRFVVADLLAWQPDEGFDVWHDRAVFHFLTDPADRAAYVDAAARAVRPGGAVVLSTFGPEGPEQCSGLPTARYDAAVLGEVFAGAFEVESSGTEVHHTPWGAAQQFTRVTLRRLRS